MQGETLRFGSPERLPVDEARLVLMSAAATIRSPIDALVELLTNSDDSYRRDLGMEDGGAIRIALGRSRSGNLEWLSVADDAAGMTPDQLSRATVFGAQPAVGDASKSVRGYFGKGLKEAILGLGRGEVRTVKDGVACACKVYQRSKVPMRALSEPFAESQIPDGWSVRARGTEVVVVASPAGGQRLKVPTPETLCEQVARHFALRRLVARRRIELVADWYSHRNVRRRGSRFEVRPVSLEGARVGEFALEFDLGKAALELWESSRELEGAPDNHLSLAGITVTSGGVPIDHRLFLSGHSAARFFFGVVESPDIARLLAREGQGFLRQDRGGLDWTSRFCQQLQREIEGALRPHFERRAEESARPAVVSPAVRKRIEQLVRELNDVARQLEQEMSGPAPGDRIDPSESIDDVTVRPAWANVPPGTVRTFTVYSPKKLLLGEAMRGQAPTAIASSDRAEVVTVEQAACPLEEHGARPDLMAGKVLVAVDRRAPVGETANLVCELAGRRATALVCFRAPQGGARTGAGGPSGAGKGGFFRSLELDPAEDPSRPVHYEPSTGTLRLFVRFPGIAGVIDEVGWGLNTERGATLFGDLVAEGTCRAIIQRRVEEGILSPRQETAEATFAQYDALRRRCLDRVHGMVRALYLPDRRERGRPR